MQHSATYIGKVITVDAGSVDIETDAAIGQSVSLGEKSYRVGQIGSLVKIPYSTGSVVGSISAYRSELDPAGHRTRIMHVHLIGELSPELDFRGGISVYPAVDDQAHIVTEAEMRKIYSDHKEGSVEIGTHYSSRDLPVHVDIQKLVLRYTAILGSTGSGKSNVTATILKSILDHCAGARIVMFDPHGEYASAFPSTARVYKINQARQPLYIPYWTMSFDELAFFLVGREVGQEMPEDKRLREKIQELKRGSISKLAGSGITIEHITADSPIPFDLRKLWYDFDREVRATYRSDGLQNEETELLVKEGDPQTLESAQFKPFSSRGNAPYPSRDQTMAQYVSKIFSRLKDTRFDFILTPGPYSLQGGQDLDRLLREWIDHERPMTILDMSGIPLELMDISIGVITRIILDSMLWGRNEPYTGRNRPLLMAYEEAHSYLPKHESTEAMPFSYARKAVEKIFKEGRKFGVGSVVITQRPSEISETILSQVGTFIALRLTNSMDQNRVKASAPSNMSALMDMLPTLRTGESIILGEAIKIPTRLRTRLADPAPDSHDPSIVATWNKPFETSETSYKEIVSAMRTHREITNES